MDSCACEEWVVRSCRNNVTSYHKELNVVKKLMQLICNSYWLFIRLQSTVKFQKKFSKREVLMENLCFEKATLPTISLLWTFWRKLSSKSTVY